MRRQGEEVRAERIHALVVDDSAVVRQFMSALLSNEPGMSVAVAADPIIALIDMTALATLKRMVFEEHWLPVHDTPEMRALGEVLRRGEEDIWDVARDLLDDDYEVDLQALITEWRQEHPDQRFVSHVRLSRFDMLRENDG